MTEREDNYYFGIHEDAWFGIGLMLYLYVVVPGMMILAGF